MIATCAGSYPFQRLSFEMQIIASLLCQYQQLYAEIVYEKDAMLLQLLPKAKRNLGKL